MKRLLALFFLSTLSFLSFGQIEINSGQNSSENGAKNFTDSSVVQFYFGTNWSKTDRMLTSNGDLFGDSLGLRADESSLNTWSFHFGIRSEFAPHLLWDGGLAFLRNGESYAYDDLESDSTYNYQTTYTYIGMPLRINAVFGKNFRFYFGGGLLPQMFFGYRQDQQWTTAENSDKSDEFKTKSGYNPFVISALANVGVELVIQRKWRIYVSPEARWGLNSSYMSQDSYIHKAHAYGLNFGILRSL